VRGSFYDGERPVKKAKRQSNHLAQVATQPIVRRQAGMRAHHKIGLAALM